MTMPLTELRSRIAALSLRDLQALCARAEVPYGTALKIRGGYSANPRVKTVEALSAALRATPAPSVPTPPASLQHEARAAE